MAEKTEDAAKMWTGNASSAWVELQDLMDQVLLPFERALVQEVPEGAAERVLDVGCGTGATTVAIARRLAREGRCVGVDIAEPMITGARARAERSTGGAEATFLLGDATTYPFDDGSFDRIVSRFGVMFFTDEVRAFSNLRRAARSGAAMNLVVWRSAEENPFMTTAERAAAPLLPNLPARREGCPGQFAFADADRVRRMLQASGWTNIELGRLDATCTFAEKDLTTYVTRLGPVGRALSEVDEATRACVAPVVRAAFEPFVRGQEVRFDGACFLVRGRAG